jgi:hypothetical protein
MEGGCFAAGMSLALIGLTVLLFLVLLACYRYLLTPWFVAVFFGVGPLVMVLNASRLDLQPFTWAKVFSVALAVGVIVWLGRATGKAQRRLAVGLTAILVLNILEALAADAVGGRWVNAAVAATLIATVAGPGAVSVGQHKGRPVVWYDLPWRWVIAYSLWNLTVVSGNYPAHWCDHFAVLAVPLAATAVFGDRRCWLEARAFSLGVFAVGIVSVIDVFGGPWIPDSPSPAPLYPWLRAAAVAGAAWNIWGWLAERSRRGVAVVPS